MRRKSKKRSVADSISHEDIQGNSYIWFQTKYMHSYVFYAQDIIFVTFFLNKKNRLFQGEAPRFINDVRSLFYLMSARNNTELKDLAYLHAHA